ncbi:hypothetical protein [Pontibacter sp. G13]|uniref:hypothetical protein n=1 Tax=Pontibacter sp. G13 TaxID=3074898 RepID=UPI002889BC92|nr:hypothetical protein [Pontibacter sp. G13]WNJ18711.1 hypothetical protein RJD25_27970 [Pontibacter sp. G13]
MSNKNKRHNKRWLITRLKTSGSRRRYAWGPEYSRGGKAHHPSNWENLPAKEGMGKSRHFYNGKVHYGLLVRFLRKQVGQPWDAVHQEILERIPTRLKQYEECIYWFVATDIERREEGLWNRRGQKYVYLDRTQPYDISYGFWEFYVDPDSKILRRVPDTPSKRQTRGMKREELRTFREHEQQERLEEKRIKKAAVQEPVSFKSQQTDIDPNTH